MRTYALALSVAALIGMRAEGIAGPPPLSGAAFCSRLSTQAAGEILGRRVSIHVASAHSCIWMTSDSSQAAATREIEVQVLSTEPATIRHMEAATKQLVAAGHGTHVPGIGTYAAWMRSPETPSHTLQVFTRERALAVSLGGANLANDLKRARNVAATLTATTK